MLPFMLPLEIPAPPVRIGYGEGVLLAGSCFTEHIGRQLSELKFRVLQNPHGILFDPLSVGRGLADILDNRVYVAEDLTPLGELWVSWQHHGQFSGVDPEAVLAGINARIAEAHDFLRTARWLVITLGSSFSYQLRESGLPVANCHRAPADAFQKVLLPIETTQSALGDIARRLLQTNPVLNIVFTISPVRHIRDGVVENNRSKARLLEAVHRLTERGEASPNKSGRLHYFPAYELVVDVLRDYRFYDADLVHPNYVATEFVLEKFFDAYVAPAARELAAEVKKIAIARRHRPLQPHTKAHREFLASHAEKTRDLMSRHAFLDLAEELRYFSTENQ